MIGQTISHYRILEKLGEGGMGVVYKAQDLKLNRVVALKFLPHRISANETEKARFLQEAQAAAVLNHPNICTIHAIEESSSVPQSGTSADRHEGEMFIVMECVDGVTLKQKEQAGAVKYDTAIQYAVQIGEALQEAHGKGIVHRDIKAENVMVNSKNQIKVMDFGLAKLKGSLKLTKTSSTVGTLAYMAPEQIQGGEVDARSDIFSFGVLLFEMLTGRLPFRGEHDAAMMYSIVNEQPESIEKHLPEASSEVQHIFNRALEKDPEDRYQTVHDMVIDLRRLKKETSRVSRISSTAASLDDISASSEKAIDRTGSKKIIWLGLACAVMGLVIVVLVFVLPSGGPTLNLGMKTTVIPLPFKDVGYGDMSLDGQWLVFPAADEHGKFDVYMMNLSDNEPIQVTYDSSSSIFSANVSPDVGTILYSRWNIEAGQWEFVSTPWRGGKGAGKVILENVQSARFDATGQRIYYFRQTELRARRVYEYWTCAPDGSHRELLVTDTVIARPGLRFAFMPSPNGRFVAWTKNFPEGFSEMMMRNLESGKDRQLTFDRKFADDPRWLKNDYIIYASDKGGNVNLWMVSANGGEAVQITLGSGPDFPVGFSADGSKMMYGEIQRIGQITIANLTNGLSRTLTIDERQREAPAFSPSGKKISFSARGGNDISSVRNIYVMDRDGRNSRKLTSDSSMNRYPFWSPDEKWITYTSRFTNEPEDSQRVFLVQADKPSQPKFIARGRSSNWLNEKQFVVWRELSGCYIYSVDETQSERLSQDSVWVLPYLDNTYVAIVDFHDGHEGLFTKKMSSYKVTGIAGARELVKGVMWPWSVARGGRDFFFSRQSGGLYHISLPEGKLERLPWSFPGLPSQFEVRNDGKEIVYSDSYQRRKFILIKNLLK